MTEQQWLTSKNPAEMYAFIKNRVTERQAEFISRGMWSQDVRHGRSSWKQFVEELCSYGTDSSLSDNRCDVLREIIGNPFRRYEFSGDMLVRHTLLNPETGKYLVTYVAADLLTWKYATIPNLIQSMMEEECGKCLGSGEWPKAFYCKSCLGRGYVPLDEPQWEMMPVIADVLEKAGCTEAAILDHLRGTEQCPGCGGWGVHHAKEKTVKTCSHCNGTGKQHVRGCWVIELLSQGSN